jgi:outer membrane protein assembly factor BamB
VFFAVAGASSLATAGCGAPPPAAANVDLPIGGGIAATSSSTDSWPTFAFDNLRQGLNPAVTNLTPSTVSTLSLRWQRDLNDAIFSSPVIYAGNMIVVTQGLTPAGSIVYDLSTADGHTIWKYVMHSRAKMTPAIDPDAGMVFVGTDPRVRQDPSSVVALRLLDGGLLWSQSLDAIVRGPLLVADGTLYVGRAGGDEPVCSQGGISAFDEIGGDLKWRWSVDPNPKEGGSVWGAISYQGGHLIFGTGNTCQSPVPTANGAVALDQNGSVDWNMTAVKHSYDDADTGGGVMRFQGRVYFISKNGDFYALNAATGQTAWRTELNPTLPGQWQGGFASPTTDGTAIVVGSGLYAGSTPGSGGEFCLLDSAKPDEVFAGYHSELKALNLSGTVLWTRTMQNRLVGYVALVPGIGFAGLNKSFVALDLRDGKTLWSYATPDYINASMVVVPSGVYGADEGGNVYAFAIASRRR